jgi:hypothetical protein
MSLCRKIHLPLAVTALTKRSARLLGYGGSMVHNVLLHLRGGGLNQPKGRLAFVTCPPVCLPLILVGRFRHQPSQALPPSWLLAITDETK